MGAETSVESCILPVLTTTSIPVDTMSTTLSLMSRPTCRSGFSLSNFGSSGVTTKRSIGPDAVTLRNPFAPFLEGATEEWPASMASNTAVAYGRKASPSGVRKTDLVDLGLRCTSHRNFPYIT